MVTTRINYPYTNIKRSVFYHIDCIQTNGYGYPV